MSETSTPDRKKIGITHPVVLGMLIISLLFLSCTICVVAMVDTEPSTSNSISTIDRSLQDYWGQAECFDFFTRMTLAYSQGYSETQIIDSFSRAEGAVKRYGFWEVFTHCRDTYADQYERAIQELQ